MGKYIKDVAELYEKHPWVRITGDEDPEKLAFKSRQIFIYSMTHDQRMVFWQKEKVREEEQRLQELKESAETSDYLIREVTERARVAAEQDDFDEAEKMLEYARSFKKHRVTVKDIRKQREKIQWERRRLTQLKSKLSKADTESKGSSET